MADVTNELLLEHLKRVQDRLARLEDGQDTIKTDLQAVKGHMASFLHAEMAQDSRLSQLESRLERVERRLELREQ